MPKVPRDTNDPAPVAEAVEATLPSIVTGMPVVICGVNRKVNIGNFETVDVYCGVTLPLGSVDTEDLEGLRITLAEVAKVGFEMASREANDRYRLLKGNQSG